MNENRKSQITLMERDCILLHEILERQPIGSDGRSALKTAILAYSWLYLRDDLRASFIHFQEHLHDPLPEERFQQLKDLGIDFGFQEENQS